ncbi:DNA topoisomerase [Amorphoplanes nipponensis]|uniref:DNA topoisomerase n=1 Tax=Actinoplanes nipponensis TaxID=135950 RepID=A0A919MVQ9_9ACTN|nr:DNA topoisomerase IB [Actinoplanes nipponensis]GIE51425.1 DNA topoisomerase [Actinoplanes nipponensis]
MRLRRSRLDQPGYGRRRSGKGFRYLDTDGATTLRDPEALARIKELVIPPAWTDVWINTDPHGHIQATGQDAAGRKQYVYHPRWRTARDEKKFEHALEIAERLPELRSRLCADLSGRGLTRDRVLAAVARLLDMGMFRVGSDQYARRDEDPSYGLSTLLPEHVRVRGGCVVLEFTGKSGVEHANPVEDGEVCQVLRDLKRRRRGKQRLFAYWDPAARRWREIRADDVNAYLREISGEEMTAKDFRTWHGTVKAAEELAAAGPQETKTGRKKAVAHAMKEVAELLGNTPAVARSSYVDPRVVESFEKGETVDPQEPAEQAVLDLLKD